MPRRRHAAVRALALAPALAAALVAVVVTAGCSASSAPPAEPPSRTDAAEATGAVEVVASTSVWGDIAQQLGGDRVHVQSLINDPSQDPHSYQPSGRDELAVSRARIVIVNGGGYDDFFIQMLDSVGTGPTVVTAVDAAATVPSIDPANEHIWFNFDAVAAVASRIVDALTDADRHHRTEFQDNLATFETSLNPLHATAGTIRAAHHGEPVAITEPLPLYLLEAAGLTNETPEAFTEAVEEGIDVTPAELSDTLNLFHHHRVKLLVYNEQSASAQSAQVLAAAKENAIPVLSVSELIPDGEHYQQWMGGIIDTLATKLNTVGQS